MLINLLYGMSIMVVCLLIQSCLCVAALRYYVHRLSKVMDPSFVSTMVIINSVMLLLVIGNVAQIALWALLFQFLSEFSSFRDAVYHSSVNFSTLGYGDIVMSDKHKLLGPLEAINGVLMIGFSTALLMAFFHDAMKKTIQARQTKNLYR